MAVGSSTLATIFTRPPQWTQVSTSMPKTRLRRCAHVIDRRFSSGVRWSSLVSAFASAVALLPRTLGVSCARSFAFGAKMPWKRVRCARGGGTSAARFSEVFPTRLQRGAGLPVVERIAYLAEMATLQLSGIEHLILVDAKSPVSFFAYPGKRSDLVPDGCHVHTLATPEQDALLSLQQLVTKLEADSATPTLQPAKRPSRPRGKLSAAKVCKAVGYLLPHDAVVIDEAITSGLMLGVMTQGGPRHDLITLTGGAIGQGLPNAVGAAIACPQRPVIALIGDGTAMYTIQALWTMAREQLNVTAIIFNNASYSVLNVELDRVGAEAQVGPKAKSQLDLRGPVINLALFALAVDRLNL